MGIGGQPVTVVVDVANVMGSRPDGWWRDRAGAAARLHADITRLAGSGRAILPDEPGETGTERAGAPGFVMVLEGAAKAAAARLAPSEPNAPDASPEPEASPVRPGEVRVVQAAGSGDDAIVAVVRRLPGRRVVVTADRELRERCAAAGAEIRGPGWLLGLISGLFPAEPNQRPPPWPTSLLVLGSCSGHPARSTGWPHFPLQAGALGRRSENRSSRQAALARDRSHTYGLENPVRTGFTGAITPARTLERMMPVRVLIAVLIVLFVCVLAAAVDRAIKTTKRNRRRLDATRRLAAAAEQAEAKDRRRKAAEQVSGALTSVMPTIHDVDTRHVDEPGGTTPT
jgi:hypothetical protein